MAVISFDFSAQATCPSDSPNSLAQTLTECKAPKPLLAIVAPPGRLAVDREDRLLHAGRRRGRARATIAASWRNRLETRRASATSRRGERRPCAGSRWASRAPP